MFLCGPRAVTHGDPEVNEVPKSPQIVSSSAVKEGQDISYRHRIQTSVHCGDLCVKYGIAMIL